MNFIEFQNNIYQQIKEQNIKKRKDINLFYEKLEAQFENKAQFYTYAFLSYYFNKSLFQQSHFKNSYLKMKEYPESFDYLKEYLVSEGFHLYTQCIKFESTPFWINHSEIEEVIQKLLELSYQQTSPQQLIKYTHLVQLILKARPDISIQNVFDKIHIPQILLKTFWQTRHNLYIPLNKIIPLHNSSEQASVQDIMFWNWYQTGALIALDNENSRVKSKIVGMNGEVCELLLEFTLTFLKNPFIEKKIYQFIKEKAKYAKRNKAIWNHVLLSITIEKKEEKTKKIVKI